MTTLLVLVVVGVLIGAFSYFTNAGFGDRRPAHAPGELPSARDIEALLAPLDTPATSIEAARDGHALKVTGRVEAVLQPFGTSPTPAHGWSARITPGDAGGTRTRLLVADATGRAQIEIPHGRVDVFARSLGGWELVGGVPTIVEGQSIAVFGVGKVRPSGGYRDNAPQLVVRAAYVSAEPPPSK